MKLLINALSLSFDVTLVGKRTSGVLHKSSNYAYRFIFLALVAHSLFSSNPLDSTVTGRGILAIVLVGPVLLWLDLDDA